MPVVICVEFDRPERNGPRAALVVSATRYLFCTWISGFELFWRIQRFDSFRLFEILKSAAERLPPPPKPDLIIGQSFTRPIDFGCT